VDNTTRLAALDVLGSIPGLLETIVVQLPRWVLEEPADADWSPKDVIAHLLVSEERGSFSRIRQILDQDHPPLQNLDEQDELERSGFRAWEPLALLFEFERRRREHVEWLRSVEKSLLSRSGNHSVVGPVSVEELVFHAANHDCLHLRQLLGMVQSHFEPRRGAMRAF
jgi:hypothetical protein